MKKNFTRAVCALLTLVMSAMLFSGTAFAADRIASLTTSDFYLDGSAINISGYNLDNTNYFRLRDLAIIFSGTGSRFDVIYNAELNRAELYLGRDYSGVNELISGLQPAAVQLSPIPYYVDGAAFTPEAYTAGNYSYVKLRDLDKLLNFTWSWDSKGVYLTSAQVVPTIEDKLREHIISGLTERSETIDLAAYSVEKDRFSEIYTEILYDHPEFFYVDSTVSVIYHSSTLLMDSAKPVYTFSNLELPTKITQFKRALASALDKIPEGLTYRETVTNINDWIVKNTTPDSKSRPTYVSAYDVLIHKRGTPGAYASAFKLLADARGVTNRIVGSDAMSVSWNQVYLGNTWYHIDCAMNDSLGRNVVLFLTDEEISQDIGGFSYYDWTVKGYSDPAQPAFKLPAAQISPSPSPSPTPSSSPKPSPSPSHSPSPTPTPTPSPSPSPTPPNVPDIAPSKNAQTFEEYVIDQLSQLKSKIDISRFGLHYSEAMKRALALVDTNPELFYVYNPIAYVTYNDSKGIAYDLTPQYAYPLSRIPAMKADFELAVNNAVRSIKRGATERETIDNINDWICDNARYDMSLSRFNAYNIFVEGIGVCDGYSRAFKVLCDRFGITCRIVTSDPMDHSWNQVYLDGAWYHIDVTWDDDLGGEYDAFFLKTDYEFLHPANAADKHYDWQVGR